MVRDTSREAYNEIKENGLLSERRMQVYDLLFKNGFSTGSELAKLYKEKYSRETPNQSNVLTRLGELLDMDVAYEVRTQKCSVTGRNVIVWGVTGNLPIKLEKVKKVKCEHCKGTGYK